MSELFWPGESRAGSLLGDAALLAAFADVEAAWLRALQAHGFAPEADPLAVIDAHVDAAAVARGAEAGGNAVIPFLRALRATLPAPTAAWVHRGLTSQDVLDTALMLCLRDAVTQIESDGHRQVVALCEIADRHRTSVQAGRTLTQLAVPTTFGLTAARWLDGMLDALTELRGLRLPAQSGGAAGTHAALVAITGDIATAQAVVDTFAAEVGLATASPWHTTRRTVTRAGDALVACTDALGHIANDILVRTRPELGELSEPTPGGSSTMPHKQNPVLAVLIKRAAIAAPFHAAQLHAAAASAVDERPDGGWHVEWAALRTLARLTASAASQAAELLEGLVVHRERMASTARAASEELLAEQRAITGHSDTIEDYLGATGLLIDRSLDRADQFLKSDGLQDES